MSFAERFPPGEVVATLEFEVRPLDRAVGHGLCGGPIKIKGVSGALDGQHRRLGGQMFYGGEADSQDDESGEFHG